MFRPKAASVSSLPGPCCRRPGGPCYLLACCRWHPRTLYQVLEETAAQYGDAPALLQPVAGKDGKRQYLTYSWNQYKTAAQEIAAGLRSIGIRKGDVVALDSETRLEFYLADLGILATGGIAAALYPSYPPKDLIRTIQNCGAKALFVGGSQDPGRAARRRPDMPRILLTGEAEGALIARSTARARARGAGRGSRSIWPA